MRNTLLLLALLGFAQGASAQSALSGVWGKEEWNCGGPPCTVADIRSGNATAVFQGVKLIESRGKACGVWLSQAGKVYRGFVIGRVTRGVALVDFGKELDHDPRSAEARTYADLPPFEPDKLVVLSRDGSRLRVVESGPSGFSSPPVFLSKLSTAIQGKWGMLEPWNFEREFFSECTIAP